jgi:hypothetical protein
MMPRPTLVLVEGASDRAAVETIARRRGLDLAGSGVTVVELGGATGIARALGRRPPGARLAGLVDAAEQRFFARALEQIGYGAQLDRAGLQALGFYVCESDLEDELIRSLGADRAVAVIEQQGDLRHWQTFRRQPDQRMRAVEQQLHRFFGTMAGRKQKYAGALAEALDLARIPRPLDLLVSTLGLEPRSR